MAFYRFTRACREVVVNFLRWKINDTGRHWDGSDWIDIPDVTVSDANTFDPRYLPAVITESVAGDVKSLAFRNEISRWKDSEGVYGTVDEDYLVYGGRGDFDISIRVAANDKELQQRITDLVAYYLIVGRNWVYYNRHILLGDVYISDDGKEDSIDQEPVYFCNLRVPASADWRILVEKTTVRRIDIDSELVTPDDPFDDMGAIVAQRNATDIKDVQDSLEPGDFTPLEKDPIPEDKIIRTPILGNGE